MVHCVVVADGRARDFVVGTKTDADHAVASARFVLRQAARGRPVSLVEAAAQLQRHLLGDAVRAIGNGPLVLSPTASLHGAPWGLMPLLRDLPISVVPSGALWLRARTRKAQPGRPAAGRGAQPGVGRGGGAAGGGGPPRCDRPERRVGDSGAVPGGDGWCGVGARRGARSVPGGQPDVLGARAGRRAAHRARLRAAAAGAVPVRAVGLRLRGPGPGRCQRAPRAGHGADVDGHGGDPVQRRARQRRGHGRADGGRAPRAGRARRPRRW